MQPLLPPISCQEFGSLELSGSIFFLLKGAKYVLEILEASKIFGFIQKCQLIVPANSLHAELVCHFLCLFLGDSRCAVQLFIH